MLLKQVIYQAPLKNTEFPFNLSWLPQFHGLTFNAPITILVGDNGVGKSTLMTALAININAILLSNRSLSDNPEYAQVSKLADQFKLKWSYRTNQGFFFRADDFISFIRETQQRKKEAEQALAAIKDPNSYERLPYLHTLSDLQQLYHTDLDQLSHGQAFLALFQARLRSNQLYLLDEPEAPLTPQNQLALLYLIHQAAENGSQFIISTHSPILMAYPQAQIIELSPKGLNEITYDEIEHVRFMRDFLNDPQRFLHYTLED